MYYKGYYHLFYQYNPEAPIWGNIVWGHAVSTDLLRWHYLEPAMKGDHWYDERGVWSGSATLLEDGSPVLLYTGESVNRTQVQNMAIPANKSDPLLLHWIKVRSDLQIPRTIFLRKHSDFFIIEPLSKTAVDDEISVHNILAMQFMYKQGREFFAIIRNMMIFSFVTARFHTIQLWSLHPDTMLVNSETQAQHGKARMECGACL